MAKPISSGWWFFLMEQKYYLISPTYHWQKSIINISFSSLTWGDFIRKKIFIVFNKLPMHFYGTSVNLLWWGGFVPTFVAVLWLVVGVTVFLELWLVVVFVFIFATRWDGIESWNSILKLRNLQGWGYGEIINIIISRKVHSWYG